MYDLFLLDYSMPELDGPQLAVEIRKIMEENQLVRPIICCCTAYNDITYKEKAMEAGMNHFLTKPVLMSQLDECLQMANLL